ncbi:MAG: hypothetical protein WBP29_03030 [Candidatus Zixiibacteriota bacterium]
MTTRKYVVRQSRPRQTDMEILEEVRARIVKELRKSEFKPRVSDLLKLLELKLKMKLTESDKEKLWELINQIRSEELPGK